ncbi:unnamed protein product [Phaeothamnion confervicola]
MAASPEALPDDVAAALQTLYSLPRPPKSCVHVTGSGGQALAWLLAVPGASTVLLEATVPYSTSSSRQWQGGALLEAPGSFCSEEAAIALATEAHRRACSLVIAEQRRGFFALADGLVVGVGCTATVASTVPKHGAHRCYVAVCTATGSTCYSYELAKGQRSRLAEDVAVSRLVIRALAEAGAAPLPAGFAEKGLLVEHGEALPISRFYKHGDALEAFIAGAAKTVVVVPGSGEVGNDCSSSNGSDSQNEDRGPLMLTDPQVPLPAIVFPGSFNPLHAGHLALLEAATALYAREVLGLPPGSAGAVTALFEISIANADKGKLSIDVVRSRVSQFTAAAADPAGASSTFSGSLSSAVRYQHPVALTRAPLFVQKARCFPGAAFVVGVDTAKRLVDPKYYSGSPIEMAAALAEIRALGCCFVVGGRVDASAGAFLTLAAALEAGSLPATLRSMFHEIPEALFRADVSSTELRTRLARGGSEGI